MANLIDANYLMDKLKLEIPLIAVYDAPFNAPFDNIIEPLAYKRTCMFAYYHAWIRGQMLKLTSTNYGCRGCGYWMFGKETRDRQEFIDFLTEEEGLKCSKDVTNRWLEVTAPYKSQNKCIYIGTFRNAMTEYLKSVTFFVNPDQLSALVIGANYFNDGSVKNTVQVSFGSGCMQILPLVPQSKDPVALVGATDLAMRRYLPNNVLAFTVNASMFEKLCSLGNDSFLNKPFFKDLVEFRSSTK